MAKMVRDVMMTDPLSVDASTSIESTAQIMRASDATDVFVTEDGGKLCGLLTDSDIVVVAIASGRHPATIPAGDCCNDGVARLVAEDPAQRAADLLRDHSLNRVPVVDDSGRLIGAVSMAHVVLG